MEAVKGSDSQEELIRSLTCCILQWPEALDCRGAIGHTEPVCVCVCVCVRACVCVCVIPTKESTWGQLLVRKVL